MSECRLLFAALTAALLLSPLPTHAQIVRDNTLGAGQNQPVPPTTNTDGHLEYQIGPELGARAPGSPNLFHSFRDFNLDQGDTATFTGPDSIRNIFTRVTGGSPSLIDGTLRSEIPNSNLIFVNPAGILFGAHTSLDVPGSFYASTATDVVLADGSHLDPRAAGGVPLLSTADPDEFGFLNPTGPIDINGTKIGASFPSVRPRSLAFIGTDIRIRNAFLSGPLDAPSDRIAIQGTRRIDIESSEVDAYTLSLSAPDIALNKSSLIALPLFADRPIGSLHLSANNIDLTSSHLEVNHPVQGLDCAGNPKCDAYRHRPLFVLIRLDGRA